MEGLGMRMKDEVWLYRLAVVEKLALSTSFGGKRERSADLLMTLRKAERRAVRKVEITARRIVAEKSGRWEGGRRMRLNCIDDDRRKSAGRLDGSSASFRLAYSKERIRVPKVSTTFNFDCRHCSLCI